MFFNLSVCQNCKPQLCCKPVCCENSQFKCMRTDCRAKRRINLGAELCQTNLKTRECFSEGARGNPANARTGLLTEITRQRVRRTTTHQHASTSWRFDLVSPWRLDHPSGSRQHTHGTLGPLRRKGRGLNRTSTRKTTQVQNTGDDHPSNKGADHASMVAEPSCELRHLQGSSNNHSASFDRR